MNRSFLVGGAMAIALAACNGDQQSPPPGQPQSAVDQTAAPQQQAPRAQAIFRDSQGTEIGAATLTEEPNGVRIDMNLASLQQGIHGFHFHAVGACDPPGFESAGPHFNPAERAHGLNHPEGPHAGDLPNIEVEAGGTNRTNIVHPMVTLVRGQPNSLLDDDGTALIVHADPDDYESQPAGNAGARIACAVIDPI